jgi:hypothetical protein
MHIAAPAACAGNEACGCALLFCLMLVLEGPLSSPSTQNTRTQPSDPPVSTKGGISGKRALLPPFWT